jgi:hypothetical protein
MGEQSAIFCTWFLGNSRNQSALSINYGFFVELNIPIAPGQPPLSLRDISIGFYLTIAGIHRDQIVFVGDAVIDFINQFDPLLAEIVLTAPPAMGNLNIAQVADWLFLNGVLKIDMFPDHVSDDPTTINHGNPFLFNYKVLSMNQVSARTQ